MAAQRPANSPREAVARLQTEARRAGGAWNRYDRNAVHDALEEARAAGLPRLMVEYGGLRLRFDIQVDDGGATVHTGADVVIPVRGDQGGEQMDEDAPAAPAPAPADDAATATPAAPGAGVPQATADAAELKRLRKLAQTATERRRRQKTNRKGRDEAAKLLAARADENASKKTGDDSALNILYVPLWSQPMGQNHAMTRLFEEVTRRCAETGQQRGLNTQGVSLIYSGNRYSVTVLSGTVAMKMTEIQRGKELLNLLGGGLSEERLVQLLTRWSQPYAAGSSATVGSSTTQGGAAGGSAGKPKGRTPHAG